MKKVIRRSKVNRKFLENDLKIMSVHMLFIKTEETSVLLNVIAKRIERRGKKWISYKKKNLYCD